MTGRGRRGAGRNTSTLGDDVFSGAASGRSSDGLIEETERSRTAARHTVEKDQKVGRLAQIIAFLGDCSLLTLATLAAVSLLTVFHKAPPGRGTDHAQPSHERGTDPASGVEL
jgi:hypothetical protein